MIVTGASQGIGYAVAEAYAMAGADVHIVAESDDVRDAAEAIARGAGRGAGCGAGRGATGHHCDVTDRAGVAALALASGWATSITGQSIQVDRGAAHA